MRNHPLLLTDPEETKPSPEAHIKPWFETDRYFLGVGVWWSKVSGGRSLITSIGMDVMMPVRRVPVLKGDRRMSLDVR